MAHSHLRGIAATAVKAVVSVALIAFALRDVHFTAVVDHLRNADLGTVALAAVIVTAISLLHARRWERVLARIGHVLPYPEALKLVLIGYFFNQTLPSTVGGDAYRVWGAYRRGIPVADAIVSVLVERIFALVGLVLMIVAGAWWLLQLVSSPLARWAMIAAGVGGPMGLAGFLMLPRFAGWLRRWRGTQFVLQLSMGARAVVGNPGVLAEILLLTIAGHTVLSAVVYLLARDLGVGLSLGHALLFVPLVTLVTLLPVSIAGWGVRESAMVVALGLIGVPSVQAFSLSVLLGLVVMASGATGGILWLLSRRAREPASQRQAEGTH